MEKTIRCTHEINSAIDIAKLIMAYLVAAIHTEPFGQYFWLDKAFGIITRGCVPFFFVASSYFFFKKNGNPAKYIKRIFTLYLVWSLIYLPFDLASLKTMSISQIVIKYFWTGNGHALWYLCGSLWGFIIVYTLSKIMSSNKVFALSIVFWVYGCLKSTYAPVMEEVFKFTLNDYIGSRNGLFYAFAYFALGLVIAKKEDKLGQALSKNVIGFIISLVMLGIESIVMVLVFQTKATILWFSVLPLTYNFFVIIKNVKVTIGSKTSYFVRKCSTLIYVSHCLFMYLFPNLFYWKAFLITSVLATGFSVLIIRLCKKRRLQWLQILG